ncbi:calcium-binding protein [Pasteurella oralis]|uniref:calcium-binding protein n=1 Tax=Pasteurella oralis TaxID=1071947 RepID=UPI00142DDE96|nr:calcium-binding protein [Pasteurella oralis]
MDSKTGPGRFVTAADFDILHLFFRPFSNAFNAYWGDVVPLGELAPGEYTKTQILQKTGYLDVNGKALNGFAGVKQTLAFYDDGQDDLLERAYIWNTTAFKITDEAIFVVEKNGNRYIKNFAIEPHKKENFDFKGGFWSNLANLTLEPQIDPSGVGKKVIIEFIGEVEKKTKFTKADFIAEEERKNHFSILNGAEVGLKLNRLIERLWNNGSIKHLYKGKPVIYGSVQDDKLDGATTLTGVELDLESYIEMNQDGPIRYHRLMNYVKNGITYVTGKGNDEIKGTKYNDIFYAGEGSDLLEGGEGHDIYYVTNGDIIIDSDGNGEIRFQNKDNKYPEEVKNEDNEVVQNMYFGKITEMRGRSAKFVGSDGVSTPYSYQLNGLSFKDGNFSATLIMTNLVTGHHITIRNFKNGQLNIYLNDLIHFDGEMSVIQYYFEKGENLFDTYDVDPDGSGYNWARLKHGSYRSESTDLDSRRDNNSNGNGSNGGSNGGGSNGGGSNGGRGSPNQRGRSPQLYDPLVLDLDGDGIETVGHNGHSGSLFDHDADGIRTSTGWIKEDDGFLVLDKDGDGKITNASELFSDMVILSDSTRAQHGFSALKDLDSNDDGVIDKQDTKFSELKLWRDLNQNGISEENELFNLSDFAIKSLHTAYEDRYDEMAGDNVLSQLGKYEKEDGSFGVMADINFSFNPFYSDFAEKLKLTEEQEKIINLRGIGRVRDLREAATLSAELNDLLQQYTIAKTREEQLALLPSILQKWAQTDNKYQSYDLHLEKTVETDAPDAEVIRLTPNQLNALRNAQHDPAVMQRFEDNKAKISTINSLYSMNIAQLYYTVDEDIDYITDKINQIYNNSIQLAYESLLLQTRLKKYADSVGFLYKDGVLSRDYSYTVQLFNETFAESPSNALTDLSEYIAFLKNPREWYEGLLLLNKYFETAQKEGFAEDWKASSGSILGYLHKKGIVFTESVVLESNKSDDIIIGNAMNNQLKAKNGDDVLVGGAGDDTLYGSYGSDTYLFSRGHGHDVIEEYDDSTPTKHDRIVFSDVAYSDVKFRREGDDLLLFGYSETDSLRLKDFYYSARYEVEEFVFTDRSLSLTTMREEGIRFVGTSGDDVMTDWKDAQAKSIFEGGLGNDTLKGHYGDDTYLFSRGHGHDVIEEYSSNSSDIDVIRFVDINNPEKLWFSRKDNHLLITNLDTTDTVTVNYWYSSQKYQVERIELGDGRSLDPSQVDKLVSAMAAFETQHGSDMFSVQQDDVKQYISTLAVASYYS